MYGTAQLRSEEGGKSVSIRGSFASARKDKAESLSLVVCGKVKADIEAQPLSSINQIFKRLEQGDVPLHVVLDSALFASAK